MQKNFYLCSGMCGAQRVIMLNQHYLGTHACVMRLEIATKSMDIVGMGSNCKGWVWAKTISQWPLRKFAFKLGIQGVCNSPGRTIKF